MTIYVKESCKNVPEKLLTKSNCTLRKYMHLYVYILKYDCHFLLFRLFEEKNVTLRFAYEFVFVLMNNEINP